MISLARRVSKLELEPTVEPMPLSPELRALQEKLGLPMPPDTPAQVMHVARQLLQRLIADLQATSDFGKQCELADVFVASIQELKNDQ